jgi:hypothetical protein
MEIPVTAIRNMPSSGWGRRHRVLACCLALTALALVILEPRAVAKPKTTGGGDACDRAWAACLAKCGGNRACIRACDVQWIKCVSRTSLGGRTGNWPGGGVNYPDPGSKVPVRSYPVTGPIKVLPVNGGVGSPVSGGNANPVSGAGNFSRSSATKVRLKTSTKYKSQSNQTRRR